jgi:TolB-like protein
MIVLFASPSLWAAETTVAVMNFANYGGPGLNYLSDSIPESISSALEDIEGIGVAERSGLDNLLDDVALKLSGVVDAEEVYRAGSSAGVDVLLLGSVSGDPGNVIVTMKAVRAATGEVLADATVRSPVATLFDKAVFAARTMGSVVAGRGAARITVVSSPPGAVVFIDGIEAGETPLVDYVVAAGEHVVKAAREGYVDYEERVAVEENSHKRLNPILVENRKTRSNDLGVGIFYLVPLNDNVRPTILFGPIFYAHAFRVLQAGLEFAFALNQRHDMDLTSPLNTPFTMERYYNIILVHASLNVLPFPQQHKVRPYTGVAVGLVRLSDYRVNQALEGDTELIVSQSCFSVGSKIGVCFFPYTAFSMFLEGRFYWQPFSIDRPVYVSRGIGSEMAQESEWVSLNFFAVGGGIKFVF